MQSQHTTETAVGQYEWNTVAAISGNQMTVAKPLSRTYSSNTFTPRTSLVTQVVRVPVYQELVIPGYTYRCRRGLSFADPLL